MTRQYVPVESVEEQWDIAGLEKVLRDDWQVELPLAQELEKSSTVVDEDIVEKVLAATNAAFGEKLALIGEENFLQFKRMVLLQSIDTHWREHLSSLDYLRKGIHLRGYAQKQPKQEYKREAFELFGQLLDSVKNEVTKTLMTVKIQSPDQLNLAAEAIENRGENIANVTYTAPTESGDTETRAAQAMLSGPEDTALPPEVMQRTGRNDPCPCGSGKKFKQCHGKLT